MSNHYFRGPGHLVPHVFFWLATTWGVAGVLAVEPELIGHWPLRGDAKDASSQGRHGTVHGAKLSAQGATFDGLDDWIEIPGFDRGELGTGDLTVAAWVQSPVESDDVPGDLISTYDPATRNGLMLSLKTHEVTTSRANVRTLHFGIDQDRIEEGWRDHGRPGSALLIFSLVAYRGHLYAGTCEGGKGEAGHVYRWDGKQGWQDTGLAARANSVSALAVHDGRLYAGTAKYRLAGSALTESGNSTPGGQIWRYEEDGRWTDCGQLPDTEAVSGLTVFQGKLHAGSLYKPAGFFRYDGDQKWTSLPTPNGKRVEALCVHNGQLFASSYDEAHIYRYDGEKWTDCGQVGDATNTQTYSFAIHHGQMYVGTWRSGKVFRYDGDGQWVDCGRLGEELEVMGMLVHNGRLLAGSLPLAGVFQFEPNQTWKSLGRVDLTPDVTYRRAWTMAEFQGRAFVGTLPSGKVLSTSVGWNATWDESFPAGWHQVTARRQGSRLSLLVDGQLVAEHEDSTTPPGHLAGSGPLRIGTGPNDYFRGELRDVRVYRGALTDDAVRELAANRPK